MTVAGSLNVTELDFTSGRISERPLRGVLLFRSRTTPAPSSSGRRRAFADDVDVDALLGQKRFQFVDANVRRFFVRSEKKFPKKGSLEQIDSGTETAASSI